MTLTLDPATPAPPRAWYRHLYLQVLVAIALGIAVGHFWPATGEALITLLLSSTSRPMVSRAMDSRKGQYLASEFRFHLWQSRRQLFGFWTGRKVASKERSGQSVR